MSEPKKKRLCLANKPTDAGVPVVTSATGGDVLPQLEQTGRESSSRFRRCQPPFESLDRFTRVSSLFLSPFIPLTSVPCSARLVVSPW